MLSVRQTKKDTATLVVFWTAKTAMTIAKRSARTRVTGSMALLSNAS
jgi:hypothetical protein